MHSPDRVLADPERMRSGSRRIAWPSALMSMVCAVLGAAIALHHPLAQPLPGVAFAVVALVALLRPTAWLVLVPGLLPVIGLAPWTGWITFEEFDLLVLAVATGGYGRLAWRRPDDMSAPPAGAGTRSSAAALIGLMIGLFALSVLVSMARGLADAGGFSFGWFQGYREPMNSVRLAKPFLAALLLWPLWVRASCDTPQAAADRLSLGLMLGLLGTSMAALWERLAFTDLLNFSTDYRTTALFWEMHVGGAALDGFLALTVPFAVREMLVARTTARWALAAGVSALACYACLTTFSRGVYLAVPVGVGLMLALHAAQVRRLAPAGSARADVLPRLMLIAGFTLSAAWLFPGSGYRGMLALLGALLVLLPLGAGLPFSSRAERIAGVSLGIVLSLIAAGAAWLLPKGPYVVFAGGVLFALGVAGLLRHLSGAVIASHAAPLMLAGFLWVLTGIGLIALHWGGEPALWQALPVLAALLGVAWMVTSVEGGAWPADLHWQGNTVGAAVVCAGLVAALSGGAYMGNRFSSTTDDFAGRLQHWQLSLYMLRGTDELLLGKGLGRYVDSYAIAAPENLQPGDYRVVQEGDNVYLKLAAGGQLPGDSAKPMAAGGDMLRFSQRVRLPAGPPQLELDVRTPGPAKLVVGVCTKHLLYMDRCLGRQVGVKPGSGDWQRLTLQLQGEALTRGAWYAPMLVVFTIGVDTPGGQVEIDNLRLVDSDGRNLLTNGDFAEDTAHWFFTSDRAHLPWHAKNLALHVVFDQGLAGLMLLAALGAGALWRLTLGNARAHALAPGLAGALVGFAAVGLFDSLLDIPRVAFVFYLMLLIGLALRPLPGGWPSSDSAVNR
jgi:hypothetical protein